MNSSNVRDFFSNITLEKSTSIVIVHHNVTKKEDGAVHGYVHVYTVYSVLFIYHFNADQVHTIHTNVRVQVDKTFVHQIYSVLL